MPIDASIISGIRPVQIQQQDPLEQYGKSLTLKHLMLQNQQGEQAVQDDNAVRSAYQQAGGDSKRLRALLEGGGNYKAIQALDKFDLEQRAKSAEIKAHESTAGKNDYETAIGKIQHGSAILSNAKDQSSWDVVRRVMTLTFPELGNQLPQQYDPAFVQAKIDAGLTMAQKLEDQRKSQELTEHGRHNVASEANASGQLAETVRHNQYGEQNPALQHIETPDGIAAFNPKSGAIKPILDADGKPVAGGKGLTESQGKATGMALRAQKAHDILKTLEDAGTTTPGIIKQGAASIPLIGGALAMGVNALPKSLGGPNSEQNRVEQAQRDFVNAVLRVESGASISESEFNNARKQYFPQPGDDAATIEQKRQNRETAIQSLKLQAGPGAKNVVSAAPNTPKKPAAVDPSKMSDAELKRELGI